MVLALLLTLALTGPVRGGLPACSTTTTHDRWAMKTRPAPETVAPIEVSVGEVLTWEVPAPEDGARHSEDPQSDRETQVYQITAYVRLVKQSPDDCDLHFEVSETPGSSARLIFEVPRENLALQQRVWTLLHVTGRKKLFTPATAPRLTFIGYGFIDYSHYSAAHPKAGHAHGSAAVASLYELHPVFAIRIP
jgi:hypothetical protein